MVACTHCGTDNQPNAVYCSNCGVPVHEEQYRRREFDRGRTIIIAIGIGLVLGMFGAQMGMRTDDATGTVVLVLGVVVFLLSFLVFRDLR